MYVAGQVAKVIELLGSYSVSLKELQDILSYLYTGLTESWVRWEGRGGDDSL